jgi:hypothetical protein
MSKLKEARSILENPDMNSQKVVAAKENISEGIGIVQERQKMIKLADTSDLGWKVVQEYERNPIAYVSEDENTSLVCICQHYPPPPNVLYGTELSLDACSPSPTWIFFRLLTMLDSSVSRLPRHMLWGCVLERWLSRFKNIKDKYLRVTL